MHPLLSGQAPTLRIASRMIIGVFNPKGGVGKTTTAVNTAAVLAATGRSVLLVDLEADMNASISLGVRPADAAPSVADVLLRHRQPTDAVRPVTSVRNMHLMTGAPSLAQMDTALRNVRQPERRLTDALRPLARSYDVVIIDAPAGFSLLSVSVPQAADHLIVPIRAEYLSLESLAHLLRWYRDRSGGRKAASIAGILLTMVDHRRQATREIIDMIRVHNRRGVFRTEIPEDPRAAEAPSHGMPLVRYARSRAAAAYKALVVELARRVAG
jgi:chromosome partitioning protein